jgi:predicted DCC family thiol-disulfide oxidoreductase YuxK
MGERLCEERGIARELGGIWRALSLLRIIPRPLRDGTYRLIPSRRYAWFGRKRQYWTPPEEIRCRFLD